MHLQQDQADGTQLPPRGLRTIRQERQRLEPSQTRFSPEKTRNAADEQDHPDGQPAKDKQQESRPNLEGRRGADAGGDGR